MSTKPIFFATPTAFRSWLSKNHQSKGELLVGFYKKKSGKPCLTWSESVDVALCFGWIDGVRRKFSDEAYTIRFTPRRRGSHWSDINIRKVAQLEKGGLMTPAGTAAFAALREGMARTYSYEQRKTAEFDRSQQSEFKRDKDAWTFFSSQAPSYRQTAIYWVTSAKKVETQQARLARLIAASRAGKRL